MLGCQSLLHEIAFIFLSVFSVSFNSRGVFCIEFIVCALNMQHYFECFSLFIELQRFLWLQHVNTIVLLKTALHAFSILYRNHLHMQNDKYNKEILNYGFISAFLCSTLFDFNFYWINAWKFSVADQFHRNYKTILHLDETFHYFSPHKKE